MKKSLGKKICAAGLTMIVVFVTLNVVLTYFFLIPFSTYLSQKQMEKMAIFLTEQSDYENDQFLDVIEQYDEDENTQVTIINANMDVICSTKASEYRNRTLSEMTMRLFEDKFEQIEHGEMISVVGKKTDNNRITVRVIKKVADDRYAIFFRSYRSLENAMHSAILFNLIAGVCFILLGFVIVYRASRKLIIPIRKMTEIAEHISNLEFDANVSIQSEDELGQLAASINKMSDHLQTNLEALQNDIENRKRLVRNLSHEIKSPIAVIMGYADRMKAVVNKNPKRAIEYCEIISNESGRIDILVKEMLEVSRFEQRAEDLFIENIDVYHFFEKVENRFREENFNRQIDFYTKCDLGDVVCADAILLERAVFNLLNNAVTYGAKDSLQIRLFGKRIDNYYELRVYNSGNGIKQEYMDSIWDAFVKVDKARTRGKQGSGVGLSIVREIVEAHNGYYMVENIEDGVEFTIAFRSI